MRRARGAGSSRAYIKAAAIGQAAAPNGDVEAEVHMTMPRSRAAADDDIAGAQNPKAVPPSAHVRESAAGCSPATTARPPLRRQKTPRQAPEPPPSPAPPRSDAPLPTPHPVALRTREGAAGSGGGVESKAMAGLAPTPCDQEPQPG